MDASLEEGMRELRWSDLDPNTLAGLIYDQANTLENCVPLGGREAEDMDILAHACQHLLNAHELHKRCMEEQSALYLARRQGFQNALEKHRGQQ